MDFRHRFWRLFHSSARNSNAHKDRRADRRRMFLESLEARMVLSADLLLDELTGFQAGDKGQPGDPLSKVGYDLASTYAYFASHGTAPLATSNSNVSLMRFDSTRTRVLVEASSVADDPSSLEAQLQGLGFVETGEFGRMVSGWLPINQIDTLAALPELKIAHASYNPRTSVGSVTSPGDEAMRADVARATFGVTGAGVKVGVISDSFNALGGYTSDVTTGDLPPSVQIIQDDPTGADEGRAMSQIVYDVAPQSSLAFATAFGGQANLASNITALANAGSQVIVDDVVYLAEPYFQNGVVAQAVNRVAAQDVSYFSSAGNFDRQSYSVPFRTGAIFTTGQIPSATGAPPFLGGTAHDFDPGPVVNNFQSFTLASGASITIGLQWDQPFGSLGGLGSSNDVDIYVLNAAGTQVLGGSATANSGGDPIELFFFQNATGTTQTFNLMMVRFAGGSPGLMKYIDFDGGMGNVAFATNSGTSFGHANTTGAAAVGAASSQQTFGIPTPILEPFSSPGGTPILFTDNGTRLATPLDLRKVDFTAPDNVATTFVPFNPFFGTSAAAPHAAGVAALMKQVKPSATATQIRNVLASTAIPMANPFGTGYNYAAGAGFIQADAAVRSLAPPITGTGTGRISGVKFNDLDGDGHFDTDEDRDLDGVLDPSEDLDGDGVLDPSEDVNGNGVLDPSEDVDGDGVLDPSEDVNGNGILDPGEDLDGDGQIDPGEDLDGDGILDPKEDLDNDGVLDPSEDVNGNGVLDPSEDVDGDGKLDKHEPGIRDVTIFVDLNRDGKLSVLEPAAVTDIYGFYTIKDVPAGTNHILREISTGGIQTLPGALGIPALGTIGAIPYAYTSVVVITGQTTTNMHFGNDTRTRSDFGDAPASFGVASHVVTSGFWLGNVADGEASSRFSANALGDDISGVDDEDGVIIGNLTPGQGFNGVPQATITVTVGTVQNLNGRLQGWIDFDQDGTFEASEKVVSNLSLGTGTHTVPISIPTNARLNPTFARFRFGFEADLGPTGNSIAGEVEDYQVTILPANPIAIDDEFGLPPNLIRQGTVDNVLDVLANDQRGATAFPQIVTADFPGGVMTTAQGGTVRLGPIDNLATGHRNLLYTPPPAATIQAPFDDTFVYRVSSNGTANVPTDSATVLIHVSLANPIAVDDTFTLDKADTGATLAVLSPLVNDLFPATGARIGSVTNITNLGVTTMTVNTGDPTKLDFSAPDTFTGTEVYQYTITDDDDGTADSTAFITVQVVEGGSNATDDALATAGYLAELSVQVVDEDLNPISSVNVGDTFILMVLADDLRPVPDPNEPPPRGVEQAYLDVLIPYFLNAQGAKLPYATPVSIEYSGFYPTLHHEILNSPAPGQVNEAGGTVGFGSSSLGENEVPVFFVTMVARQSTVGEPGGVIQFRADSPDGFESNRELSDIAVESDTSNPAPVVVFHEIHQPPGASQVLDAFFRESLGLKIVGPEGEFVNLLNPLDVDLDNDVTAGDALTIINSLNAFGSILLQAGLELGKVDCDMDSYLTASDALTVINYINSQRSVVWTPTTSTQTSTSESTDPMYDLSSSSSSTTTETIDTTAADELYAMEAAQEELRSRFKRR